MNIILVPVIGILGVAVSTLDAFMLRLIVVSLINFRQLPFGIDLKFIAKAVISSLVMGAVVWALSPTGAVNILLCVIASAIIYFVVLRGFTRQE